MALRSATRPARLLAVAIFASLALAQTAAGGSEKAKGYLIAPETILQMAGSTVYCTVKTEKVGPVVACFHLEGSPTSKTAKAKGYVFAASDAGVLVEAPGSTTPAFAQSQPSLKGFAAFGAGKAASGIIPLHPGDFALVGGTHMEIIVTSAKGGGNAIGVLDVSGNKLIPKTYTIGLSDHFVTVVHILSQTKTQQVYRHAVFS